jgi:regulator of protease activity HflC (stomatin/prohibitin superfamily)
LSTAERERRAKVINAEGEFQAAQRLAETSRMIEDHPMALQLRYLQTLSSIATENPSTPLFPVPIDLLSPFVAARRTTSSRVAAPEGEGFLDS